MRYEPLVSPVRIWYVSTVYARETRRGTKVAVQHHHAHVASAMAENRIDGPAIGIAFAQWIREGETRSLPDIASDVLHELVNLTGTATGSLKAP